MRIHLINTFINVSALCVSTPQGIEHGSCRQHLSNKYEPQIPHTCNGNAKPPEGWFPPEPIRTPKTTCLGPEEAHQLRKKG